MLKTPHFWSGTVLFALLYMTITVMGTAVLVLWAAVSGVLCALFWRLLNPEKVLSPDDDVVAPVLMAAAAAAVGALTRLAIGLGDAGLWDFGGLLLATGTAWGIQALRRHGPAGTCFLCKSPMPRGAGFACPRCRERVCESPNCWNAKHFRCTLCHEREVVLFPIRDAWWAEQLGPRATHGQCSICYKESHETDLRECGQCGWPMCRRCWDYHNGLCSHCGWLIRDVPRELWGLASQHRGADGDGRQRSRSARA
jgi:hypothetical protein